MEQLYRFLTSVGVEAITEDLLARRTSMRVGGNARVACFPKTREQMITVLDAVRRDKIRYAIIGNGSNVIFSDEGFSGLVIFTDKWRELSVGEDRITASAGVPLVSVATVARDLSLSGLEFAYGIPGTVGGAVFMNAGAFGASISDVCVSSEYYDLQTGEIGRFAGDAQAFAYRSSIYEKQPRYAILGATLELRAGEKQTIAGRMEEYLARRKSTQPLEYPNAGSVFKRPEGHYAGKLIEDCGLKGVRIGGAEVSVKHAGFIVNRGGATAEDVRSLVELIRDRVKDEMGVSLECEIRFL